jgi:hypothetical protein
MEAGVTQDASGRPSDAKSEEPACTQERLRDLLDAAERRIAELNDALHRRDAALEAVNRELEAFSSASLR